ncbi:MAG TPA: 50S ribosomal protein L24 [Chloroflexia bacterium]|nr:50S ribosomal protein L24 [Chloroflexia bacterium]
MNIRKGDTVQVITGKYRSKKGAVKLTIPSEDRVVVEGVNVVKKHIKARSQVRQAGIVEVEAPIHVSNVMLVDPNCGEAVRVGHRIENGEKVRYCKHCNKTIPDRTGWQNRDRSAAEER